MSPQRRIARAAVAEEEEDAAALLREAARLREEAEAEQVMLDAKRRLQEEKEKVESEADFQNDVSTLVEKLEVAEAKLRKAEAFQLPDKDALKQELAVLQKRQQELQKEVDRRAEAAKPPEEKKAPPPQRAEEGGLNRNGVPIKSWTEADWEDLAKAAGDMDLEQRFNLGRALGPDGRRRLDKVQERLAEERAKAAKRGER